MSYLAKVNQDFGVNHICIPIEKLFGIKVHIFIRKDKYLIIESQSFFDNKEDEGNPVEIILFRSNKLNTFEEAIEIIKKLKYNNIQGCFQLEDDVETDQVEYYLEIFKGFSQVEFIINNCCVCQEAVKTKTDCNHYLCLSCADQIKPIKDDNGFNEIPCPICRENIVYDCNFG